MSSESFNSSESSSLSSSSEICGNTRKVNLRCQFQRRATAYGIDGCRLTVTVLEACNMEPYIFRFLRHPPDLAGVQRDQFTGVCSGVDYHELPVQEPNASDDPPTYRDSSFDIVVESTTRADEVWTIVKNEVGILIQSLNNQDNLETVDDVWID